MFVLLTCQAIWVPIKTILFANLLVVCWFIEYFGIYNFSTIVNSGIIDRGVTSLATEPTFLQYKCFT